MAQLKDLIVNGASQLIGDVYTSQIQISKLNALTSASATTYGAGSAGQALMSNGTNTYWGDIIAGAGGNAKIFYGTCSTAGATTAKEVTCADFTSADLVKGAIIYVTFNNTNTGTQSSLTLNVNSTGAKPLKYMYNNAVNYIPGNNYLLGNQTYLFHYDGTNWVIDNMHYNTNTNTQMNVYAVSNNIELPLAGISKSTTAEVPTAYSTGLYGNVPATTANRATFNQSTGMITVPGGVKTTKIQAPTAAGGTTYGAGSSGQALMSNGSTVYWGNVSTTLKFTNKTVAAGTSGWTSNDTTYSGFPYKANITCAGVTPNHVPNVIFDYNELISGNFCPFADSTTGIVSIYCKIQPTAAITIPTIYCT